MPLESARGFRPIEVTLYRCATRFLSDAENAEARPRRETFIVFSLLARQQFIQIYVKAGGMAESG